MEFKLAAPMAVAAFCKTAFASWAEATVARSPNAVTATRNRLVMMFLPSSKHYTPCVPRAEECCGRMLLQFQRLAQPLLPVERCLLVQAMIGLVPQNLLGTVNRRGDFFSRLARHIEVLLSELQEHRRGSQPAQKLHGIERSQPVDYALPSFRRKLPLVI